MDIHIRSSLLFIYFVMTVFWRTIKINAFKCDISKADVCAVQYQNAYDDELLHDLGPLGINVTQARVQLCLSTLKDNNVTKCFKEATKYCNPTEKAYISLTWNETESDIVSLCNKTCRNYKELEKCEKNIDYKAIQLRKYAAFCSSYEDGLKCSRNILDKCAFNESFYIQLIKQPTPTHYRNLCLTGCVNLDETMAVIMSCYDIIGDVNNKDEETRCISHHTFKQCLFKPDKVCREFAQLLPYYKYETMDSRCTTTTSTTTEATTTQATTEATTQATTTEATTTQTTTQATTTQATTTRATSQATTTLQTTPETTLKTKTSSTTVSRVQTTIALATLTPVIHIPRLVETTSTTQKSSKLDVQVETQSDTTASAIYTTSNSSSVLDCITRDIQNISATDLSPESCIKILAMASCIFNKTATFKDLLSLQSFIPNHIHFLLNSNAIQNCTFAMQREWIAILQLANAGCQDKKETENENTPLCTGHGFGMIYCAGGADLMDLNILILVLTLLVDFCVIL